MNNPLVRNFLKIAEDPPKPSYRDRVALWLHAGTDVRKY